MHKAKCCKLLDYWKFPILHTNGRKTDLGNYNPRASIKIKPWSNGWWWIGIGTKEIMIGSGLKYICSWLCMNYLPLMAKDIHYTHELRIPMPKV